MQANYFGEATLLMFCALIIIIIMLHTEMYGKCMTKKVVETDFMLITGGEKQTFGGGFITVLYFVTILFVSLTLIQEQIILNEWIDSTQMASQNSELLVTNTLFIDMKFFVTQISLNKPNSE